MRRILNTFSNNLGKAKAAYSMLTDDTKTANYTASCNLHFRTHQWQVRPCALCILIRNYARCTQTV